MHVESGIVSLLNGRTAVGSRLDLAGSFLQGREGERKKQDPSAWWRRRRREKSGGEVVEIRREDPLWALEGLFRSGESPEWCLRNNPPLSSSRGSKRSTKMID